MSPIPNTQLDLYRSSTDTFVWVILGHVWLTVPHSRPLRDPADSSSTCPGEGSVLHGCHLYFIAWVMREVCAQGQMLNKNHPFAVS